MVCKFFDRKENIWAADVAEMESMFTENKSVKCLYVPQMF